MAPTMSDPWPQTYRDVLQRYHAQYDQAIASGQYQPFIYPWGTFGAFVVIIYLLIPHQNRPWLGRARFLMLPWIAGFAAYSIKYTRAKNMASAFGLGIISAWSILWITAIVVVNDCQTDFQRIERMEGVFRQSKRQEKVSNGSALDPEEGKRHQETISNGNTPNDIELPEEHLGPSQRQGEFAWQPYPLTPFIERLDWVLDIFCNFRGTGWNWRIPSLPPPPKSIQLQLARNSPNPPPHSLHTHPSHPTVHPTGASLLRSSLLALLTGYLTLDLLKTLMTHDPYFWGLTTSPPPPTFPPIFHISPLTHTYRLFLSMYATKTALNTLFSLSPLLFSSTLTPSLIGARAAPWIYPDPFGSYTHHVLDRGLAGWWSGWWHQTFSFAFRAPASALVHALGLPRKGVRARVCQVGVAFALSGFLHACGSFTQPGTTRPLLGPMRFFAVQAGGVLGEGVVRGYLRKMVGGQRRGFPKWVRRGGTFLYVHVWFYYTAHLLCDDFAQGGIWLFEPVPISIFRGLGFGVQGDGWWCWGGEWVRLVRGEHWWQSGIAL